MFAEIPRNQVAQVTREIPKEVLFRLSPDTLYVDPVLHNIPDARQDGLKRNKFWFKFPEEWSNRNYKDKVLGIRSIYLLEDWFDIQFDFGITCKNSRTGEPADDMPEIYIFRIQNCFVGRQQTLRDVCDYFNKLILEYMDKYEIKAIIDGQDTTVDYQQNYCQYKYLEVSPGEVKCYIFWNGILGYRNGVYVQSDYCFTVPNLNARKFFGDEIFQPFGEPRVWHPSISTEIWDRKALYILSSIATSSDKNSYLGHTRGTELIPIKYYRLDSTDKEFWVEFYSTRDHRVPVDDLPRWSDFHIEAIFMYNTTAML